MDSRFRGSDEGRSRTAPAHHLRGLYLNQQIIRGDLGAGGGGDFRDGAVDLGQNIVLHLHRFQHRQSGADCHFVARLDEHLQQVAMHGSDHAAAARRILGAGGESDADTA